MIWAGVNFGLICLMSAPRRYQGRGITRPVAREKELVVDVQIESPMDGASMAIWESRLLSGVSVSCVAPASP